MSHYDPDQHFRRKKKEIIKIDYNLKCWYNYTSNYIYTIFKQIILRLNWIYRLELITV